MKMKNTHVKEVLGVKYIRILLKENKK